MNFPKSRKNTLIMIFTYLVRRRFLFTTKVDTKNQYSNKSSTVSLVKSNPDVIIPSSLISHTT